MPEGHTIHRLAADHKCRFGGRAVAASSLQGRFAAGAASIDGHVLVDVSAYGKHLFYSFTEAQIVHVHLGLYGTFASGRQPAPQPRGALRLRLATRTDWADLRGATACELLNRAERAAILARLGPDPLRRRADAELAWARLSVSRRPIGALLMDQSVLAGVGNVFRAETLFRRGIGPHRPGRELAHAQWDALWVELRSLLRAGVRAGRIVTTRREHGPEPYYVYRRAGQPCRICASAVRSEPMAGRTLYWCPSCQPG